MNASRAWFERDFYAVLGVGENASADEIKRAYKKLATTYHPDRNPDDPKAEERMKEVSEAYGVLGDPQKRSEYDQVRRMSRAGFSPGGGGPGGFGGGGFGEGVPFDIEDLFGGMFGGRRGSRAGGRARRGPDLEARIRIPFEDAYHGATVPVHVRRDAPCSVCNGSGDRSGQAQICPTCGGTGMSTESQGMFSFARTCPTCGGSGRRVSEPCSACAGSGVERRADTVKVKIPAGIRNGARIRVRARGGAVPGGQTGDLYVVVEVESHPMFGRKGDDLTLTLPLSYPAAALGAKVKVPTMNGDVTLKIPAGTQPGKTFRVRGKGMPSGKRATGDLLVTAQVEVPKKLSKEEKRLIEELAALNGAADGGTDG